MGCCVSWIFVALLFIVALILVLAFEIIQLAFPLIVIGIVAVLIAKWFDKKNV